MTNTINIELHWQAKRITELERKLNLFVDQVEFLTEMLNKQIDEYVDKKRISHETKT